MSKRAIQFSAIGFILSSIGAAVGLGNIWRFPQQMVEGGGSSFIMIYFLILILVCLPIFILEINYGVFSGKGVVKTFAQNKRILGTFVGWKQAMLIIFLSFYYLVIVAWIGVAFVLSLIPDFFKEWSQDETGNWFDENILKTGNGNKLEGISDFKNLIISPWVIVSIVVIMLITFGILLGGIKNGLEKANYVFVPGFFVMLVGLAVYTVFFLKDGKEGMEVLFDFNFEKVSSGKIWFEATKQGIFSTGILIGVLIVFSKNADVRMDKNSEAILVVLFDTFIALIAGLLVVGLISHDVGKKVTETGDERSTKIIQGIRDKFDKSSEELGGSKLLFAYLPGLFWTFNGTSDFGWGNILMLTFSLTLLFAALSSLIALVEVGVDSLEESFNIKKRYSVGIIFGLSLVFLGFFGTSMGPELVGKQDTIIVLFITIIGLLQIFILAANSRYKRMIETNSKYSFIRLTTFNWLKVLIYTITFPLLAVLSVFGILEISGILHLLNQDYHEYVSWMGLENTKSFKLNLAQIVSLTMFGILIMLTVLFSILSLRKKPEEKKKDKTIFKTTLTKTLEVTK